jgi:hypothetical protein
MVPHPRPWLLRASQVCHQLLARLLMCWKRLLSPLLNYRLRLPLSLRHITQLSLPGHKVCRHIFKCSRRHNECLRQRLVHHHHRTTYNPSQSSTKPQEQTVSITITGISAILINATSYNAVTIIVLAKLKPNDNCNHSKPNHNMLNQDNILSSNINSFDSLSKFSRLANKLATIICKLTVLYVRNNLEGRGVLAISLWHIYKDPRWPG